MSETDLLVFLSDSENGIKIDDDYYNDSYDLKRIVKFKDIKSLGYINNNETILEINMVNGSQYRVEML